MTIRLKFTPELVRESLTRLNQRKEVCENCIVSCAIEPFIDRTKFYPHTSPDGYVKLYPIEGPCAWTSSNVFKNHVQTFDSARNRDDQINGNYDIDGIVEFLTNCGFFGLPDVELDIPDEFLKL